MEGGGSHNSGYGARPLRSRKIAKAASIHGNTSAMFSRCRFLPYEIAELEKTLARYSGKTPPRTVIENLAIKFSNGVARNGGHAPVQEKQIQSWFRNKIHRLSKRNTEVGVSSYAEQLLLERAKGLQFEALSNRDGAWYDVKSFLGHKFTSAAIEIYVSYSAQGRDAEEWVELNCIRQRSLACEGFECLALYPGDSILCYQEGDEHALYYDAKILDVLRKRHDARGCRCRFWIRYDHDQFEEVVSLKKVCRRPETDLRLKQFESGNILNKQSTKLDTEVIGDVIW